MPWNCAAIGPPMSIGAFRIILAGLLLAVFAALQFAAPAPQSDAAGLDDARLHVFFQPDCPHCHEAIAFLRTRPEVPAAFHDVSTPPGRELFRTAVTALKIDAAELGVPLFVFRDRYLVGFDKPQTTGVELEALVTGAPRQQQGEPRAIALPIFGEIDPSQYSLLGLTVVMALADGLNPCAMWVLVYLISLIAALKDRRKIWWLVGTFILASGVLYFLFMAAWLKAFLVVGYVRPLTQFIALMAIGFGIAQLYELWAKGGQVECEVGDAEQHQRTVSRIRDIVVAPIGIASLLWIIGLALTVNIVEFLCSAALPAVYTHTLALMDLPAGTYYGYIALYVLLFMLDDLVIFGLAIFAVQKIVNSRFASISRVVGGVMLLGLGLWMLMRQA